MARPRIDEGTALKNAVKRFKVLVTYFDVTRPQYDSAFKDKNGRFSKDIVSQKMNFLSRWNPRQRHSADQYRLYAKYSSEINYTFSIPSRLVETIIGSWRDDDGVRHRIPVEKVVSILIEEGWLKMEMNAGAKFKKVDGRFEKRYWFNKKYLMNEQTWNAYIDDPAYSDYTKYPGFRDDPEVKRAIHIISKWRNTNTESIGDLQAKMIMADFKNDRDFNRAYRRLVEGGHYAWAEDLMNSIKKTRGNQNDSKHETRSDR